jgi:hypothetical protein
VAGEDEELAAGVAAGPVRPEVADPLAFGAEGQGGADEHRRTQSLGDPASFQPYTPFSFVRRSRDVSHVTAATFELQHDEKIFGTGESFTRLDKRGQKLVMYLRDGQGVQNYRQYKAVPFFLSNKGYGVFAQYPVTFDFGHDDPFVVIILATTS